MDGAGPGVAHTRTLTLVSSRFSRKTGRAGGIWPSRKWNHCNTTVTLGNRSCLGEQKMDKNRIRFCSPIANQKQSHGPQTGAALRPPKCNERRATDATIWHSQHGPWPASSPLADFVQSGHLTISMNFSRSCASLKHLPPSATTQGSRGISTYDWWISPPPPLQVSPHRSKNSASESSAVWRTFALKCSHFVDGYPRGPDFTPLHRMLSPTSGGHFDLMFVSGLKPLIHASTSIVVAGIGAGINGATGASPP